MAGLCVYIRYSNALSRRFEARPSLRHAIDATDAICDEVETKQSGLKRWLALLQSGTLARLRGWRVKRGGHGLKLGMQLLGRGYISRPCYS